jgi:hypothetical protein
MGGVSVTEAGTAHRTALPTARKELNPGPNELSSLRIPFVNADLDWIRAIFPGFREGLRGRISPGIRVAVSYSV